jgi:alpha-L-rhamnosidase
MPDLSSLGGTPRSLTAWPEAEIAETPSCRLKALVSPPIRVTHTLAPVAISEPVPGVHVFDFGQNFAGWCRLRVRGNNGARIEMRFAEMLLPSGEVDQSNLRSAKQTDKFILHGNSKEEIFEPKFTYHGFRYVQVSGLPEHPAKDSLDGIVIHSDLPITGQLRINNPLVEQIWRNTVWTQGSNLMGLPTDCPQRDERSAQGDECLFWDAAAFNMDVQAFTHRQMDSVEDSRWCSCVVLPYWLWQRYADVGIIEQHFDRMTEHIYTIVKNNTDCIWRVGGTGIGDWLAVDEKSAGDPTTPHDLNDTALWAHWVDCLAQMAQAVDREADSNSLRQLHARIRNAFIDEFIGDDGRVGNGSQTGYVLALKYGLIPENLKGKAAERLSADVRGRGHALSTGFVGTQYLLDVLADSGYVSLAYDLLLRTEYPSWGYMIAQGATTIWESWNGRVWSGVAKGDAMPCSRNHFALGAVCGFLFRRVAGIDAAAPGFETIRVRPALDPRVTTGGGDYDSVVGRISTNWTQAPDRRFTLEATIPANSRANIHLPVRQGSRISEGGKEIARRNEMRVVSRLDDEVVIAVGSGSYRFEVTPI